MSYPQIFYEHFLKIKETPILLREAFTWDRTSEGFNFWCRESYNKELTVKGEAALLKYVINPPDTSPKKPIRWV